MLTKSRFIFVKFRGNTILRPMQPTHAERSGKSAQNNGRLSLFICVLLMACLFLGKVVLYESQTAGGTTFSFPDRGGASLSTGTGLGNPVGGYGRIQPNTGQGA